MNCVVCNNSIPAERLEALPDTQYCIQCTDRHSPPVHARLLYNHKTAGEVIVVRGKENARILEREYKRGR